MAAKQNQEILPSGSVIDWSVRDKGKVLVTCGVCKAARFLRPAIFRDKTRWTGFHIKCARIKQHRPDILEIGYTPTAKICRICGRRKPATDFYSDSNALDKRRSECKPCMNTIRRKYAQSPNGRAKTAARESLPARKQYKNNYTKLKRIQEPEKIRARQHVADALRSGKMCKPDFCQQCASRHPRIEAHHDDYAKPLDVQWLCPECHGSRHRKINYDDSNNTRVA